ncbi:MAG: bifunctional (p)ppGpp synthetase/guanosine-3',5'-bis(diphosphate) 3'-pyrophosphohydrolase [Candidatus Glassbacteria bacterium]|nr:bifunctional (p)ppGpp synthetase/guanosine-3',5'-bis(diphosphate) 3'-pyrophosphohydrolase [Candidatus Glassbacteria bacterium]
MSKESLFKLLKECGTNLDLEMIERAYDFGAKAHQGQKRNSGEDYITHTDSMVRILIDLKLYDSISIASALIHDVAEDTEVTLGQIEKAFGAEIAGIVQGVTKISRMDGYDFRTVQEEQVENYRKLILSMARDIRVILIKFVDRLHNMRTLNHLPEEKRRRIAKETLDIYAPLAHRFGIALIRWELEDLAFKYLEPEKYHELAKKVAKKRTDREALIERLKQPLQEAIDEAEIEAEVTGRPKHLYSIYKKIQRRSTSFEELYDLLALRVLTHSVADCYYILGIIHSTWTPLHVRFKDYIATPKSNMYQSLHTTVYGPEGHLIEIQIRTNDMHRTAEYGIAAHWKFKEGSRGESELDKRMSWLREVLEWQSETTDPREFMEFLKIDLFHDEVFVFTPRGMLIKLPAGSTLIDFAFAVHTEVGLTCIGGKIDGKIAPLHTRLKSGQTVEIITNQNSKPSKDWIQFVRTTKARNKIRHFIREQEFTDSVKLGREMLERELKKKRHSRLGEGALQKLADHFNLDGQPDKLYAALGQGNISPGQVISLLFPDEEKKKPQKGRTFDRIIEKIRKDAKGIRIQGIENMMVSYAKCCQPVPGDKVVGYITRGRGVSIHRADCPNLLRMALDPDRRVDVNWKSIGSEDFLIRIIVAGTDRKGMLADLTKAITDTETNIRSADISSQNFEFSASFVVEVKDLKQLKKIIGSLERIQGVDIVKRREYFSPKAMGKSS